MKNFSIGFLAFAVTLLIGCEGSNSTSGSHAPKLSTKLDTISYVVGFSTGDGLTKQGLEDVNLEVLNGAMNEALAGEESKVDLQQATVMIRQYIMEKQQQKAEENKVAADKFFEDNGKKDGIVTTESGLQYEVIEEGEGPSPVSGDEITAHYHGTLTDGTVFDSSVDKGQPITMNVDRFVPGFSEGLKLMNVGSKYKFYIPPSLGYGERATPAIEANSALVFDVELIEINPTEEEPNAE